MLIANAPLTGQVNALADWVEFKVLVAEFNVYRLLDLQRLTDEGQEWDNPDIAEQDALNEEVYESVIEELTKRSKSLTTAYPFILNDSGTELQLDIDAITEGGYVYLYCLFFSHIKREDVLVIDPPHTNEDRDIMQICATYAAAGIVRGNSVSFGFPRPNNTGFLEALKITYKAFGEGIVHDSVPAGAPVKEKDARVDIISWENSLDGAAGKQYLLGQVATGKNWGSKSILGEIDPFHQIWFTQQPASKATASMFIPFCIDNEKGASDKETLRILNVKFGHLYYRYRLPKHAEDGLQLAHNDVEGSFIIERVNEFNKVQEYVDKFLDTLSQH